MTPRVAPKLLAAAMFLILAASSAEADPDVMRVASLSMESASTRPSTARIATRYLGATGPQLGLPARLWCGDFINLVRRRAGLAQVPSRRAIDQARYGVRLSRPEAGALLITGRRGGHHVDLIVSVNPDGTVTTIGGNIRRRVTERVRAPRGLIIRPL